MWNEITENKNYPSETCNCMIETTDGAVLEARFIAPTCSFISTFLPTYHYKNVKRWKKQ